MTIAYTRSESTEQPLLIEITSSTVYLRKDIVKEERSIEDTDNKTIFYIYQEAKLTPKEFNEYASHIAALNAVKGVNDSDNISQIVENGVDSSTNQLVIMEAMADLYDLLAALM